MDDRRCPQSRKGGRRVGPSVKRMIKRKKKKKKEREIKKKKKGERGRTGGGNRFYGATKHLHLHGPRS
jgi:hypothetical protein